MPAQLMRMSQRPKCLVTSLASALTDSTEDTSHVQASACRPACSTMLIVLLPEAISAITIWAPSCIGEGLPPNEPSRTVESPICDLTLSSLARLRPAIAKRSSLLSGEAFHNCRYHDCLRLRQAPYGMFHP